jgi:hypothetical protein
LGKNKTRGRTTWGRTRRGGGGPLGEELGEGRDHLGKTRG